MKVCIFQRDNQQLVKEFVEIQKGKNLCNCPFESIYRLAPIVGVAINEKNTYFATCANDMTISVFDFTHMMHDYTIQVPEKRRRFQYQMNQINFL